MLSAAQAGVTRIVYTSSVATLGREPSGRPADEHTPVTVDNMTGHYKRSKFLAEEDVKRLVRDEKIPVVIVNPSTIIGPGQLYYPSLTLPSSRLVCAIHGPTHSLLSTE